LLLAAVVISLLCIVVAFLVPRTPVGPDSSCRPALQCISPDPIYWMEAGLIGLVGGVALMVVTLVTEAIDRGSDVRE
jgi:hypothetical protein